MNDDLDTGKSARRGCSPLQMGCSVVVLFVMLAILFPATAPHRPRALASHCQSNLKQIGVALNMYTQDHDEAYPTNRRASSAKGTPPTTDALIPAPASPEPEFATYVVALEKYIRKTVGNKTPSVWKCPEAAKIFWPTRDGFVNSKTDHSRVSYAINYYLLERSEGDVRNPASTLAFRELGLMGQSYAVPFTLPPGGGKPVSEPYGTFLPSDLTVGSIRANKTPHREGSNILFVDGHVERYKNSDMVDENLKNTIEPNPSPYRWALCRDGNVTKPLVWITP